MKCWGKKVCSDGYRMLTAIVQEKNAVLFQMMTTKDDVVSQLQNSPISSAEC